MNAPATLRLSTRALVLGAAVLLAACSSRVKLDDTPVESRTPRPVGAAAGDGSANADATAGTGEQPQSRVATVDLLQPGARAAGAAGADGGGVADPAAAGAARTVYFDYDSYAIKDEFRGVIDSHARLLSGDRARRLQIEGHTDERGGREYNLALGQKRADAVVRALKLLGAADSQLEAVSYGKERPLDAGHDEAAWARNRRAELKDR